DGCALDWHVGFAGPADSLERVRQRESHAGAGRRMTCRPYPLGDVGQPGTWRWLNAGLLGADGFHRPSWSARRGKARGPRRPVREGPDAVRRALEAWRLAAGDLRLPAELDQAGGFLGDATPLLDAVELLDIHLPLEGPTP